MKYSLYSALIFFLIANPATYRVVNSIIPGVAVNGCPTAGGLLLHTGVFFLALIGIMMLPKDKYDQRIMRDLIVKTAIMFALLGYIFSSRSFILFLNQLNPFQGLLFYYLQLFVTLEVLQWFGLVVGGVKMQNITQTIGELMVIFAFFILVDQESAWVAQVIGDDEGKKKDYPVVYTQAEDGAVYYLWSTYVTKDPNVARMLTFVVTPAILVSVGLYLTGGNVIRRELFR